MIGHKRFYRGVAFSHPGAFIQQRGQFQQRRKIHRHQFHILLTPVADCRVPGRFRLLVTKPLRMLGNRQAFDGAATANRGAIAGQVSRRLAGERIAWLITGHDVLQRARIAHCQRKDGHAIQGLARRYHAFNAEQSLGGFQSHQIVQPRRHPTGAGSVRAQGKRHQAPGDHRGGTGTGTTTDHLRLEGIGYRTVRGAGTHQPGGELVQVGFTDQHRTGGFQAGDGGGVLLWCISVGGAGGGGLEAHGINIVLHREWHTV